MKAITNFESLTSHLKTLSTPRRVAVVWASDEHTEEAVARALKEGFANFIMVGQPDIMERFPALKQYADRVEVIGTEDKDEAARIAVKLVRDGKADVIMKGLINTDNLLRAILNKEEGILPKGNVLTHLTVLQIPGHHKLLFFSDPAVIPYPTMPQRVEMVRYMAQACRAFGIEEPRIALIHCSEKISPKFPVTLDYEELVKMAGNGDFGKVIVDGPMDVKTALESESGAIKGIQSPIEGDADALIFPDIEAGNVFYKTMTHFCHAETAGMLRGTMAPVVVTSRSDSAESKYCSLATACLMSL